MSDWLLLGNDRNKKSYGSSSEVCVFQKAVAFFLHLKKVPGPVGSPAPQRPHTRRHRRVLHVESYQTATRCVHWNAVPLGHRALLCADAVAKDSGPLVCISSAHRYAPVSHQTSLIKPKFKTKMLKNFKMATAGQVSCSWSYSDVVSCHLSLELSAPAVVSSLFLQNARLVVSELTHISCFCWTFFTQVSTWLAYSQLPILCSGGTFSVIHSLTTWNILYKIVCSIPMLLHPFSWPYFPW